MLKVKIRDKNNVAILDLEGNIDIDASNFVETVGWVLDNKSKDIICNFEEVNIVDYVGVSLIAVACKNVLNHNGKIKFCNIPAHVRNLFSVVGLDRVFEYFITEEQALKGIREEKKIFRILKKQLRRRFKRVPANIKIEFKRKLSDTELYFKGKIINLSAVGAFVVCEHTFPLDDLLSVRMHLLPKPGIIDLDAKVVWVSDEQLQAKDFPGMGFEFYEVPNETQQKIIEFVERNIAGPALNRDNINKKRR